jgi:hypothetical protein
MATTQAQFREENSLLKFKGDEDGDWDAEGMESIYRSTMVALHTMREVCGREIYLQCLLLAPFG